MDLKAYVLERVKPDDYYASRFPTWNARIRGNVRCPFHIDRGPSLAIGLRNGGAKCHGASCGKSIGNIVHFEAELKGQPEKIVARKLYAEFIRPTIDKRKVQEFRNNLTQNSLYILKIKKDMGLSPQGIRRFALGFDTVTRRITIPVYDQFGQCINIRYYRLPSERQKGDNFKIYNEKGFGAISLFPLSSLDEWPEGEPIFFMAGEKDTMLAVDTGLRAITSTTGEGSWNPDWDRSFRGRDVCVVFDRDKGGIEASKRIARQLSAAGARVQNIELPFFSARRDFKDFTDWIRREKHNSRELLKLVKSTNTGGVNGHKRTRIFESGTANHSTDKSEPRGPACPDFVTEEILPLADVSSRSELLNLRIKTQGIVAAKASGTFSIPWRFQIKIKNREPFFHEFPLGRELLRLVRTSDTQILQFLQKIAGTTAAEIIPTDYLTVSEVEVIPTVVVDKDVPYVVQRCFYFGSSIESNIPYYLEMIPTSEIRTQETIGIITRYTPLTQSIEQFSLTPEVQASLSVFSPEGEGVWEKFKSLANEISHHYTHVYNRLDWHMVALLTWCSPLAFYFPGDKDLQRGYLNSLALGDTEVGKSKVAKHLQSIFDCGVFINSENCTYVGLIGGAIKMGSGQFMLRWGRIPLSNRQLVVLEELSGLSVKEISDMSDVRSSGVARLDKGGISASTSARTRLLCLSNVRSERRGLSNYLYGVYAVRELVGHGEDIARFDLITTLVDREVSNELINAKDFATVAKTVHSDQLRSLCQFIWSLNADQIHFTNEAYEACLDYTKKLASRYHPSIPIFKGGSGRYKLARIAAAIACIQFSWDDQKKQVIVNDAHVRAGVKLLELIYSKPSMGYREYSLRMFDRETIKDAKLLEEAFTSRIPPHNLPKVLETLIHSTRFTRDELQAIAGLTNLYADQLIGTLVRERAVSKGEANIWQIEPAGKLFMEKLMEKANAAAIHHRSSRSPRKNRKPPRKLVRPSR